MKEWNFQQCSLQLKKELRSIAEIGDKSKDSYPEEDRLLRK
jgi:hypothetical protein